MKADDKAVNTPPAVSREQTLAMALSAWDMDRTRRERAESPRARVITLRTHGRLIAALEARQQVPLPDRSYLLIQDGARNACLLIHGTQNSPAILRPLADHLHGCGLTIYAPKLPGHSFEQRSQIAWRAWSLDIRLRFRLLRQVYRRVHVVGYGFGAALAIHLASKEQVAGLALLAPAIIPRVTFFERILFLLGIHRLAWLRPRMGWHEEVLAGMKKARARVPRLRTPIYAAQCEDDERISSLSLRFLQKHVRHKASRFQVFPSGGHDILATHGSEVLYGEIQKFFRGRD